MNRTTRYQAAIVQDDHLLLLKIHDRPTGEMFWIFPGGGCEPGESEEQCVAREVLEETHLRIEVVRFLFEAPDIPLGSYQCLRTYLCRVRSGVARPGREPEMDSDGHQTIRQIRWFDLRQRNSWDGLLDDKQVTFHLLQRVRAELGFMKTDRAG